MAYILINKNSNEQLKPNFKESEFYSKCSNAPQVHKLDYILPNAVQYIRDYYNIPIEITSTLRTESCNVLAGGVSNSMHLYGKAIDFQFAQFNQETLKKIYIDFANRGELYKNLREIGINGFGFYNTFIHLDTRDKFTYWDNTNSDFGQVDLSTGEKKNLWRTIRIIFQPEALQENKLNFVLLILLIGLLIYLGLKKNK